MLAVGLIGWFRMSLDILRLKVSWKIKELSDGRQACEAATEEDLSRSTGRHHSCPHTESTLWRQCQLGETVVVHPVGCQATATSRVMLAQSVHGYYSFVLFSLLLLEHLKLIEALVQWPYTLDFLSSDSCSCSSLQSNNSCSQRWGKYTTPPPRTHTTNLFQSFKPTVPIALRVGVKCYFSASLHTQNI